ncbi:hypothetical protein O6H91_01G127500 [Diphasiastrum complanatum]|nr:hypothetical protein O6H91_01G127500 [Diphasiastrum complanatum]
MRKVEEKPDPICICGTTSWSNGCLKLSMMQELRRLGYNAAICKSKWDPTAGYPGGVYEYLDVITVSNQRHVIIDVEFLGHFEIARPTRQYRAMLKMLPPIFVGRPDSLQQIVNLMCEAEKISLNERQLHFPPWRKCGYIQAKWFSAYTRVLNESDHLHRTGQGHEKNDSRVLAARELNMEPRLILESEVTSVQAEPKSARRELRKSVPDRCGKWLGHRFEEYGVKRPSRVANKMLGGRDELTVVSTDWQPPSVQPKTSQRFRKVAGLAAVLGQQAEASIQKTEQKHLTSAMTLPKQVSTFSISLHASR